MEQKIPNKFKNLEDLLITNFKTEDKHTEYQFYTELYKAMDDKEYYTFYNPVEVLLRLRDDYKLDVGRVIDFSKKYQLREQGLRHTRLLDNYVCRCSMTYNSSP